MGGSERLYIGTPDGLLILAGPDHEGRWHEYGRTLAGEHILALVALDATTLLAALDDGPPRQSFDGGQTWDAAPGAPVEPLGLQVATSRGPLTLANPRLMGATAYARLGGKRPVLLGAGAGGGLLFRSEDDGIHWEPAAAPVAGRIAALIPAALAGGAWAGTEAGQILRSVDRGLSWHEVARVGAAVRCLAATRSATENEGA